MARDFRYVMPDGSEVEAFQMHEASRYQQKDWPEWMDSKLLMTKQNAEGKNTHWLNVGDVETEIPQYGWIVRRSNGSITAVDYSVMEAAEKVVREIPNVPEALKPQSESALRLAAKITKRPYEEVKAEDEAQVRDSNRRRQAIIDSLAPEDAEALGLQQSGAVEVDPAEYRGDDYGFDDLVESGGLPEAQALRRQALDEINQFMEAGPTDIILELCDAYEDLADGKIDEARVKFRNILSQRVAWCNCPPGQCAGLDPLICRTKRSDGAALAASRRCVHCEVN